MTHYNIEGHDAPVPHDGVRIMSKAIAIEFLKHENIPYEMEVGVKDALNDLKDGQVFQLAGDGDELGLIYDVWASEEDCEDGENPIIMRTFMFEDCPEYEW